MGVATDEAIVSGPAPGSCAVTSSVGKSTLGRSLTGRKRYATRPNSTMAAMSRLVAMGRLMKPSEIFKRLAPWRRAGSRDRRNCSGRGCCGEMPRLHDRRQVDVEDRREIERDQLRHHQAADHREAERTPRLAARAVSERDRHRTEQ